MSYEVNIEYKDDLIRVYTNGASDYNDSFELYSEIVKSCKKYSCYRVLARSGLTAMSTVAAFEHIKIYEDLGITKNGFKFAWFVADPIVREKVEDIAAMLRNRNLLNGFVFSDYAEAQQWLLQG